MSSFTDLKVYNTLQEIFEKDKVIGILGNMDSHQLRKVLPEKFEMNLYGHKIFLTHGTGGPDGIFERLNEMFDLSNYDIILFGHIHRPYNERWRDGKLYISPGTPTDRVFTDVNSYGYLRIARDTIEAEIIYL